MPGATYIEAPDHGVAVPWSPDVASAILSHYAGGMPLYRIAALAGFPAVQTMYEWKVRHPEWATALAHARAARAERIADEGLDLVDAVAPEPGPVGKVREQANYRRWLAGCLDRATYGDALKVDANVQAVVVMSVDLSALLPTPAPQAATIVEPVLGSGTPTLPA